MSCTRKLNDLGPVLLPGLSIRFRSCSSGFGRRKFRKTNRRKWKEAVWVAVISNHPHPYPWVAVDQAEREQAPSLLESCDGCISSDGEGSAEVAGAGEAAEENLAEDRNPYLDCGGRGECSGARVPAGMQHLSDLLDEPAAMASL